MRLHVKVVPGAARDRIAGWLGEALKIRVAAPAERGRANDSVEELLTEALRLPRNGARIVSGLASPRKVVEITGLDDDEVRRRLASLTAR